MPRLESVAKGGYYPFPPEYIPAFASLFQPAPPGGLLLDPCAGEGAALAAGVALTKAGEMAKRPMTSRNGP